MEQILMRQNEDLMLKMQYSARFRYNQAEIIHYILWALCILSWLSVFLPSDIPEYFLLSIPFVLEVAAAICEWRLLKAVSSAAMFRNYFDAYVFELDRKFYSKKMVQELRESSYKIVERHPKDAAVQMTHTGMDTPPGVKDWYNGHATQLKRNDAIYECQCQNYWWDKKLTWLRLGFTAIFGIIIVVCFLLLSSRLDILRLILCSAGLILKLLARVATNVSYIVSSIKIEGVVENLSDCHTIDNLTKLQGMISQRRKLPILGQNIIHKHLAKRLSELYQVVTKN